MRHYNLNLNVYFALLKILKSNFVVESCFEFEVEFVFYRNRVQKSRSDCVPIFQFNSNSDPVGQPVSNSVLRIPIQNTTSSAEDGMASEMVCPHSPGRNVHMSDLIQRSMQNSHGIQFQLDWRKAEKFRHVYLKFRFPHWLYFSCQAQKIKVILECTGFLRDIVECTTDCLKWF